MLASGGEAILTSYAAKGELPDGLMANNVPACKTDVADLTDFVTDDPIGGRSQVLKDASPTLAAAGLRAAQFIGLFRQQRS
jgi:hypothetical protein